MRKLRNDGRRFGIAIAISLAVAIVAVGGASAQDAADEAEGAVAPLPAPAEVSFRVMYGHPAEKSIEYYSFGPRLAFETPDWVPEIYGRRPRLAVELMGSVIDKLGTRYEIAFTPLLAHWRADPVGPVVPYLEAGFGGLWTNLTRVSIGGRFEFSNNVGFGGHIPVGDGYEVTLGFRFRHISNAGLARPNHGINTGFFLLGFGWSE